MKSIAFFTLFFALQSTSNAQQTINGIVQADNSRDDARHQNMNRKTCHQYIQRYKMADGKVYTKPILQDESIKECMDQCPKPDGSKTTSIACFGAGQTEYVDDLTKGPGVQWTLAECTCDSKVLDDLSDAFIKSLASIGEILCDLWVASMTGVIDYIIDNAIDNVDMLKKQVDTMGGLTDAHKDLFQGALQFHAASDDLNSAKDCFGKWVASKTCSQGSLSQNQTDSIFSTVYNLNQIVVAAATLPAGGEGLEALILKNGGKAAGKGAGVYGDIAKKPPPLKDPPNPIKPKGKPDDAKPKGKPDDIKPTAKPDEKPTPKPDEKPTPKPDEKPTPKPDEKKPTEKPKPSDKTDKTDKTTPTETKTNSTPKDTSTAPKTSDTKISSTTSPIASACSMVPDSDPDDNDGLVKRRPQKKQKCADDKVTITSVEKSIAVLSTSVWTCDYQLLGQACAHYYSAIKNYKVKDVFTCTDNQVNNRDDSDNPNYVAYGNQHGDKTWKAFTAADYKFAGRPAKEQPNCEKDEFPPKYFLPARGDPAALLPEWGQRIRLLPRKENGGAGAAWNSFCKRKDGGVGNGQRIGKDKGNINNKGDLAAAFVDIGKAKVRRVTNVVQKTSTITEYYDELPFTRAVFSVAFASTGELEKDDWMLRRNPCWPKDIVPEDPGYVLLTDDLWYTTDPAGIAFAPSHKYSQQGGAPRKWTGVYNYPPDAARLAAAKARRPDVKLTKREDEMDLVMEGGVLMIRDETLNVTRHLTDEEHDRVELEPCRDRKCSGEDGLTLPGSLPSTPAMTDAIPTPITRVKREAEPASHTFLTAAITEGPHL